MSCFQAKTDSYVDAKWLSTKFIASLLAGALVVAASATNVQGKPVSAPGEKPTTQTNKDKLQTKSQKRTYGLGIQLQCTERTEPVDKSYDRIKEIAEISYTQRSWDEWLNKRSISFEEVPLARSKGLKIYAALDLLSYDDPRAHLILANKKFGLFADPKVKADYLALVQEIAVRCKPEYFILLVEANLYKDKNPADYEAFRKIYPEAVALVKRYSPATQVGVSITYGDHNNRDRIDAEDDLYFQKCVTDFDERSDLLPVSTYPFFYLSPEQIPLDFLSRMASFSRKPLFLTETSWVSESFDLTAPKGINVTFKSSPDAQCRYYQKIAACADYALSQKRKIEAINFISLNDPRPLSVAIFKVVNRQFAWFCSLAVSENSGKPKPAFQFMKAWKAQ
ncbi:MAG: hypothetical protein EKK48_14250 [Candidatus Melainabacteria bacterium]|nr:MAG: hypothetical protein EKK48_14250 [Candidatus Melainabacteria bacterium]